MGLVRYDIQLYKEINKDQELVTFFSKLTKCFEEEQTEQLRRKNLLTDNIEPDFSKLITMAEELKELDIDTGLLFNDFATIETNLRTSTEQQIKREILGYDGIAFNSYLITSEDIDNLRGLIEKTPTAIYFGWYYVSKYMNYGKAENGFDQNLKKEQNSYNRKKRMFGSLVSKSEKLIELENQEKELKYKREKGKFFAELTQEQARRMLNVYDSICNMRDDYRKYLNSCKVREEQLKRTERESFIRAISKVCKSSEKHIVKIQTKFLKALYLTYLNRRSFTSIEFLGFYTNTLSFNVELVDWFVEFYEKELLKLSSITIENFDLLFEPESSKILSKKITEG